LNDDGRLIAKAELRFLYPTKNRSNNARDIFLLNNNQTTVIPKNIRAMKGKLIARKVSGQKL
jgi:hypothetical protein